MSMATELDVQEATTEDMSELEHVLGVEDGRFYRHRLDRPHQPGVVLVARLDGRPAGALYIAWGPADEPKIRDYLPDVPILHRLRVRGDLRGNGIGSRLLVTTEVRLYEDGHDRVAVGIATGAEVEPRAEARVKRFYLRNHYREWEHGIVPTTSELHPTPDEVVSGPDQCRIFVKRLGQ